MKILHTADWHLGRTLHGCSLLDDQAYVIEQIKTELTQGYDAVLIAGDVYDRAIPSHEACQLFGDFLNWAVDRKLTVIGIPGNHDSPQRLGFADRALEKSGVFVRCDFSRLAEPITVTARDGQTLDVFALPFVETPYVREELKLDSITDVASATAAAMERIRRAIRPGIPSVLVAHAFVGETTVRSESEREFIGGAGRLKTGLFAGVDYVALGHLHRPQSVDAAGNIRYSGSPLQYSFSETDHEKLVWRVEWKNGKPEPTAVPLRPRRRVRVLEDSMERLLNDTRYGDARADYVSAVLTDADYLFNVHARLKERFPLLLQIRQPKLEEGRSAEARAQLKQASSDAELFGAFLNEFGWEEATERAKAIDWFQEMKARVEAKRREVTHATVVAGDDGHRAVRREDGD